MASIVVVWDRDRRGGQPAQRGDEELPALCSPDCVGLWIEGGLGGCERVGMGWVYRQHERGACIVAHFTSWRCSSSGGGGGVWAVAPLVRCWVLAEFSNLADRVRDVVRHGSILDALRPDLGSGGSQYARGSLVDRAHDLANGMGRMCMRGGVGSMAGDPIPSRLDPSPRRFSTTTRLHHWSFPSTGCRSRKKKRAQAPCLLTSLACLTRHKYLAALLFEAPSVHAALVRICPAAYPRDPTFEHPQSTLPKAHR